MKNAWTQEIERLRADNDALTDRLKRGQALSALNTVILCAASFFTGMFAMTLLTQLIGG